ncbi:CDP-diacylglycerol--serine O-phosphatidyltransferase [Helicobacter muridarum]|uniref:CDP-diacylglycerol--serine O-phosphatidyltransferase n=1 Tax=Helicobacter muridarum TaxID=216 RepID=A0A377PTS7_9HELI|nr:CDP-diacylglycerol--serine O-phosphatidyltransferase [Helicobacter muridarum]TLD98816.1 CDP-diacylglycerol--serine O-phosphatidyltransferase [Helicobacter muridarum]STQ85794.1 phosphatidylserine synthase [Helicobacter muridarum]
MKLNPLYILPNLFTAASIFMGILAILIAYKAQMPDNDKDFILACWCILFSMILDALDGRVARLTNTASKFGVEFDSLADVVAFGVSPAVLLYFYVGYEYGRYGIAISGLFVVLGAVRLARFNITTNADANSFIGLPIPSAAAIICLWILVTEYNEFNIFGLFDFLRSNSYLFLVLAFIVSLLMVSNVRYPSFKKFTWDLKYFVWIVILLALVVAQTSLTLCAVFTLYVLYGILRWIFIVIFKIIFKKKHNSQSTITESSSDKSTKQD